MQTVIETPDYIRDAKVARLTESEQAHISISSRNTRTLVTKSLARVALARFALRVVAAGKAAVTEW
jgi:hypothetical protein